MDRSTSSGRGAAARLLVLFVLVAAIAAACGSAAPGASGGAAPAGDPAAVVKDALAKVAARDLAGIGDLACAGQADRIRGELDMSGALGAALPGVDTAALADSVQIDTSGVTVGTPTISGDTAQVPVSGTMKISFDAEKLRPILKQVLEGQGQTMTDAQIDALLATLAANAQSVPLNESLDLKQENGAWKICEDVASPAAS